MIISIFFFFFLKSFLSFTPHLKLPLKVNDLVQNLPSHYLTCFSEVRVNKFPTSIMD